MCRPSGCASFGIVRPGLPALTFAGLAMLAACGPARPTTGEHVVPSPSQRPSVVWKAAVECPKIGTELSAVGEWVTQAATDPPRTCVVIDVDAGNSAFITLGQGIGDCTKLHYADGTPVEQLHGLGARACLATHVFGSKHAAADIGISFDDHRSIDVACSSTRTNDLAVVVATCRSIAEAAILGLGEG